MGKPEHVLEAEAASEAARSVQETLRRSSTAGWTTLLLGALGAALLLFVLLFRLPGSALLGDAGDVAAATERLGRIAVDPAAAAPLAAARTDLARRVAALQDAVARGGLQVPELAAFRAAWTALPAAPDAPALQALADAAARLSGALRQRVDERQAHLERWLKGLTVLVALTLVLPIHGLWRQRQRVRASLHQFSEHLGAGDWQDAVQSLREDRLGAPSAFDALASGLEDVLGESDRRWRALADLSADWYWETDAGHRLSWISGASPASSLGGRAPDDLLGRRRDEISFLEAPPHGWDAFHRRLDRHEAFRDVEFRAVAAQGEHAVWISISGRPRFDARGDFVGYEGVGRDITERKSAHERLAASEQRWSLMAGLASDWYWETDAEHRILPLAPEFKRRFPSFVDSTIGRTRWDVHRAALTAEEWAEHRADLDARRPFRGLKFEVEAGPGRFLWLSISGIPRFDGQGRFVGYHGVGRDITVRKHAERLLMRHNEELQRAVEGRTRELEQLNRDLDAFSRQLAHELRTPISHVQGLAHLLEARAGGRLTDDERQLIELQVQAARSMRDTVDALLLLARSTVQAMPIETVDVSRIALAAIAELPPIERRASIDWRVEPGLIAQGSPAPLRIVLSNLLGNAAKFTRQVEQPRVRVSGRSDADGRLRVCVEDNGAGFDPALAERLFVPFNRLHAGEEFHGTGIGLSIVQRIVERHGGSVAAHGEPGRGARFEFTLAAAGPSAAAPAAKGRAAG